MRLSPRVLFAAVSLGALVLLPLPRDFGVFDTSIFLVEEDVTQPEDAYALSQNVVVAGLLEGDLVTASNRVTISGRVTGDLLVASSGTVTISGTVDGSVRGIARTVVIEDGATVGDDVAVVAMNTRIRGSVGRDAIVFGGKLVVRGSVGRDLHGRFIEGSIDGEIGRTADIATTRLDVGPATAVGGNLLYRSNREADVDAAATVAGTLRRLSPRPGFFIDIWWTLATVLGFLAFIFTGLAVLWLFRGTSEAAVGQILERPWRTLGFGLGALVGIPVVIALFVVSLIGVPVAVLLGVLYLLGFFFGPIPAVAAAGSRLSRGRGGLFAAFLIGAIAWRAGIAFLGFIAGGLYAIALVWGVGGWAAAVWAGGQGRSESSATEIRAAG